MGEHPTIAIVTGIGTAQAHAATAQAATAQLLDTVKVEWVIVVGISGAIDNQTPIGTLVLPELVVSGADCSQYRPSRFASAMLMARCGPPTACSSIREFMPTCGTEAWCLLTWKPRRSRRCANSGACPGRCCARSVIGPAMAA
ncbi:phosphorylase superfamily protein [Mycobacterium xenopi 3993]|nr:phosphorylase superfamily protein [Mycobacterium xenopi 3993]